MNKGLIKRATGVLLTAIMIFTALSFGISAATLPEMSRLDKVWYSFGRILSYQCLENELRLNTTAGKNSTTLSVTFPSEGGIRIHNETEGFFKPNSLNNIEYQNVPSAIIMTVDGKKKAVFNYGSTKWSIDIYNKSGSIVFSLSASDIFLGCSDNAYSSAKFTGTISEGEIFTGLGERYSGTVLNGESYTLWNRDSWSRGTDSYVNVPILHSTNGYSLFYNSSYGAEADIGKSNRGKYSLEFNGPDLDFYIWTDTPLENIKSYTSLTGKPATAPKWAFGYWAGGTGVYWKSENTDGKTELDLVKKVIENYKTLGTVPSALYGEASPSANKQVYDYLKSNNIYMLGWNHPGATWEIKEFNTNILKSLCPGIKESELPAIRKKSDPSRFYQFADNREWIWGDYTNPNALNLITNKMRTYWIWGVRGAMVDYGEYVYEDTVFDNGMTGDEMHNFYPYYYNKTVNQAWSDRLGDDYVLFARAGCAGSQAFAGSFGGDQQSDFEGLRQAIYGGISISSSGFSNWGSDIGGLGGIPTEELYNRWLQFATFSPFMRAHGSNRNPWYYESEATNAAFQKYYWLRENLLDTIYSANIAAGKYGVPMMQSMQTAFPENAELKTVEDQYMFCNDLLVCPVYSEGAVSREVTFPQGIWYDIFTGKTVIGGTTEAVEALIDEIPVFVASGAVLPVTLSSSTLKLTDSISGDGRAALLITPPTAEKSSEFFTDGEKAPTTYTASPVSPNTFNIKSDGSGQARLMVVYGTSAASVICDGKTLAKISGMPTDSTVSGYYIDTENGCTYIALPSDSWQSVTVTDSALESFSNQIFIADGQSVENAYGDIFSFSYNHEKNYIADINPDDCFKSLAKVFLERKRYNAINEPNFASEYFSRTAAVSPKNSNGTLMTVKNFTLKLSFRVGFTTSKPNGALFIGFRQKEAGHYFDGYSRFNPNQSFLRLTNTGITVAGGSGVPRDGNPDTASKEDISFEIAANAGDLNDDGAVNIIDLVRLKKNAAVPDYYSERGDMNGDRKINSEDIADMKKRLMEIPGVCELKELISTADAYITLTLSVKNDTCYVTLGNGRNEKQILCTYSAKLLDDSPEYGYLSIGIGDTVAYSLKSISLHKLL